MTKHVCSSSAEGRLTRSIKRGAMNIAWRQFTHYLLPHSKWSQVFFSTNLIISAISCIPRTQYHIRLASSASYNQKSKFTQYTDQSYDFSVARFIPAKHAACWKPTAATHTAATKQAIIRRILLYKHISGRRIPYGYTGEFCAHSAWYLSATHHFVFGGYPTMRATQPYSKRYLADKLLHIGRERD